MASDSQKTQTLVFLAALILCGGYYWLLQPALLGPFVFDDFANLQHLALLGNDVWKNLGDYLAAFEGNPGRPLAALSFLIDDSAWPTAAYGFKHTNLLIHIINGFLLLGLIRQLQRVSPALPQQPVWPLMAMAAWLFHPMHISAQMLVVQRMTLLAGTFSLAGIWIFTALVEASHSWRGAFAALTVLAAATVLAVLSKESGALLPLYALVLQATLLTTLLEGKDDASRRLLLVGCAVPTLLVIGMLLKMGLAPEAYLHREFDLSDRLLTQSHVLLDYLRGIAFPSLTGNGIYNDDFPVVRSLLTPLSTPGILAGLFGALLLAWHMRVARPLLSFAVLWFFAGHLMESTVLPLELYFEHRNYVPLLGPVLAITSIPFILKEHTAISHFFLGLWLAALVVISGMQAPIWGQYAKMVAFWSINHPKSLRATQELAKYYYENADPQASVDIMMYAYEKEGVLSSDLPLTSLLTACWQPGVAYKDVDFLEESLRAIPASPFSNGSLVVLQKLNSEVQQGGCDKILDKEQWWKISDALLANPKFKLVGEEFIRVERAKLKAKDKDLQGTMQELETAYAAHPNIELSYKIAETLISAGLLDDAEDWLIKGLSLEQPWFKQWLSSNDEKSKKLLSLVRLANKVPNEFPADTGRQKD